ncbi:MAG: hypothetical protein ABIH87_00005 [bacterium]
MSGNFINSMLSSGKDVGLFFINIFHNKSFLGFVGGLFLAVLVIGFILTKNPRHLPIILRYSDVESFEKIAKRDKNGTYLTAFSSFLKIYTRTRTLFLMSFIVFITMIITAMITYNN